MKMNDVTMVFCTCDAYSDLWENFFMLLRKYWPEFDGEIILNTEQQSFQYEGFRISAPLLCSQDVSWSDRLSLSLKKVKTPYVLIMLEDFYLKAPVDHSRFIKTVDYMKANPNAVSITYLREPGIKKYQPDLSGFCLRKQFSLYKMTAHITLYQTDYLRSVLKKCETAWEFEVNGTVRAWFKKGMFFCAQDNTLPIFPYDYGRLCIRGTYWGPVKRHFESAEQITFSNIRETSEEFLAAKSVSLVKKFNYLVKGLLSVFKENAQ